MKKILVVAGLLAIMGGKAYAGGASICESGTSTTTVFVCPTGNAVYSVVIDTVVGAAGAGEWCQFIDHRTGGSAITFGVIYPTQNADPTVAVLQLNATGDTPLGEVFPTPRGVNYSQLPTINKSSSNVVCRVIFQ